jgi:hypothetical protein
VILAEAEVELQDKINETLMDQGLRLELFDGAYCVVEDTEED